MFSYPVAVKMIYSKSCFVPKVIFFVGWNFGPQSSLVNILIDFNLIRSDVFMSLNIGFC